MSNIQPHGPMAIGVLPTRRPKETAAQRKAIKEGRARKRAKFIADRQAKRDIKSKKAIAINQSKIRALKVKKSKKLRLHKKFVPLFGKKVDKALVRTGKRIEEGSKVVVDEAGPALDWAIEHSGEIADSMAITGGVLIVVGGAIASTGLGAPVGGPIAALGGGLEAAAPVVRSQGARAKKIKDIVEKIIELTKLIKSTEDAREQMLEAANILEEASKINNDKELKETVKIIRDSIKIIDVAITHGKLVIHSIEKGDIIAGVEASIKLGDDLVKGKKTLESVAELLKKAKKRLTPEGKRKLIKEDKVSISKDLQEEKKKKGNKVGEIIKKVIEVKSKPKKGKPKKEPKKPKTKKPKKEPKKPKTKKPKKEKKTKAKRKPSAYNIFVKEKRKQGLSMKEVGAAWQAQKKK